MVFFHTRDSLNCFKTLSDVRINPLVPDHDLEKSELNVVSFRLFTLLGNKRKVPAEAVVRREQSYRDEKQINKLGKDCKHY